MSCGSVSTCACKESEGRPRYAPAKACRGPMHSYAFSANILVVHVPMSGLVGFWRAAGLNDGQRTSWVIWKCHPLTSW